MFVLDLSCAEELPGERVFGLLLHGYFKQEDGIDDVVGPEAILALGERVGMGFERIFFVKLVGFVGVECFAEVVEPRVIGVGPKIEENKLNELINSRCK